MPHPSQMKPFIFLLGTQGTISSLLFLRTNIIFQYNISGFSGGDLIKKKCRTETTKNHEKYVYCKRGYFRWWEISRKCWQDISRGGNFYDTIPISFIKVYRFYFRVGVIFAKKTKTRTTLKLPHAKFFTFTVFEWEISP